MSIHLVFFVTLNPPNMVPTSLFSFHFIHNFKFLLKINHFIALRKVTVKETVHMYSLYLFSNLKLDKEIHSRVCRLIFQGGCQCEDEFAKGCEIWDHEVHFRLQDQSPCNKVLCWSLFLKTNLRFGLTLKFINFFYVLLIFRVAFSSVKIKEAKLIT